VNAGHPSIYVYRCWLHWRPVFTRQEGGQVISTCATTRAIHLEIVQDLTADTFLMAFHKFTGRRSLPHIMISCNGSTYLSASEELHFLMFSPTVKQELGKQGVSWQFIPKRWGLLGKIDQAVQARTEEGTRKEACITAHLRNYHHRD